MVRSPFAVGSRVDHVFVPAGELRPGELRPYRRLPCGPLTESGKNGLGDLMVRDATAGTTNEEGDGYQAALVNFRFMAHALWTTREAVGRMREAPARP